MMPELSMGLGFRYVFHSSSLDLSKICEIDPSVVEVSQQPFPYNIYPVLLRHPMTIVCKSS